MKFDYFTLSENRYPNNPRSPEQFLVEIRDQAVLAEKLGLSMALVQLFFRRPAGAVDHSPALDGRALTDFFCPACQVFIFVRLQESARVVVGGAVQHAVAVPRPDRHIGDRIFVAGDELIARKLPVEHVELTFHFH